VPIKLRNERLLGKNTRLLGGKPLIAYCLNMLLSVGTIDERYVYCSDESICEYLPDGVSFLLRPAELDLPTANFTQIFDSFSKAVPSDVYIYAHATAPFVKPETVNAEIDAVLSGEYDSAFCAERIQDFLWKDGVALNFNPENIPQSQDLPVVYRETSGVYVFDKAVFEIYRRRVGLKPYIAEVSKREAIDINTSEDFQFAELLLGGAK
jgi:CMP-N-acetylneuraminic acid synthetase